MAGRKPKPIEIKLLEGSRIRGKQKRAPKPKSSEPAMPKRLSSDKCAAAKWSELLPLVSSMQVMTDQDVEALATLCEVHSAAQVCLLELRASGPVLRTDLGGVKPNPAGAMYRGLISQQMSIMSDFGLTPASRCKLDTKQETTKEENPLKKYLTG
jgi:P27 family predicted phage terminase small subunit